jgi:hypothetical protein
MLFEHVADERGAAACIHLLVRSRLVEYLVKEEVVFLGKLCKVYLGLGLQNLHVRGVVCPKHISIAPLRLLMAMR